MGSVISLTPTYNMMIDFTPKKHRLYVGTTILSLYPLPALLMSIHLAMISNDPGHLLLIGFL